MTVIVRKSNVEPGVLWVGSPNLLTLDGPTVEALREYFANENKPWMQAKNGELWLFKQKYDDKPAVFRKKLDENHWMNMSGVTIPYTPYGDVRDEDFVPYRLWPLGELR